MMTTSAQKSRSREDVKRLVSEQRSELAEQAKTLTAKDARVEAVARLATRTARRRSSSSARAALDHVVGRAPGRLADAEQALDQLRRVLARRSYAA